AIASPSMASTSDSPKLSFSCQTIKGVPATVAKSAESENQITIFQWKQEALANRTSDSPEELCHDVAQKLEDYAVDYDLSNVNFIGTTTTLGDDVPTICANVGRAECGKVLFTLDKTTDKASTVAGNVVDSILAKDLQPEKTTLTTRGVQSISYEVNFLSLLGLNFNN
ncbi:MAG: COP23 domain-containing protein, partial [Candidatus Nanopelagicaceae bacterium]